ncbi:MAG: GAF domain-containing protein [Symploca sp. SIO2C1]|nr:GAF domain-containing protein [Symploca sp. SIO2C1]
MTNIPQDLLRELVVEEGLSDAELEALSLALDGKSPTEIKELLKIKSENAVQKKLGKIYAKFRISGKGPGKLPKLQKILTDRFQAKQGKKKVLISWYGSTGKFQAEGLKDILAHPQVEALLLDTDMSSGSVWFAEIEKALEGLDFGVICLPKGCSAHPEVNSATGYLFAKLQYFRLVHFSQEELTKSLLPFPKVDGTKEDDLAKLLNEIIGGELQEAKDWVNFKVSSSDRWEKVQEQEQSVADKSPNSSLILNAGLEIVKDNKCFHTNQIFQYLIINRLNNIDNQLEKVGSNGQAYSMPFELYPRYLTFLQQELTPSVKSVAIIENAESFWGNEEGDEVAKTANYDSERLFVFPDLASFKQSTKFLLEHASCYKVFVTTLDKYLPLAAEFSSRGELTQWQGNHFALPTKEYAIIQTSDEHRLLAWYHEDNSKSPRNKKVIQFSAKPEEINLYEQAFETIKNAQGVIQFSFDHRDCQEQISEKFEQIKQDFYEHRLYSSILAHPEQLLKDLHGVRNELIALQRKEEIIPTALKLVRERLHCQTAAIFLFHKDGRLHREGIQGVDIHSHPIDNKWFADESYAVGQSFTGKAALPKDDGYGEPQWTNDFDKEQLQNESSQKYSQKLGSKRCIIAVPLNGHNKTYGVIEVINKVDLKTGKPHPSCGFAREEIHWLSAIGSYVATAISNSRRNKQNQLYTDLLNCLVEPRQNPQEVYQKVTCRLCSPETAFKVCIIRVITKSEILEEVAKCKVEEINWEGRIHKQIKIGENFTSKAIKLRKPQIVPLISEQIDNFKNKKWVERYKFASFACFPLISQGEVLGTLSVYTGYKYDFHPSTQKFLEKVASLIAAFVQGLNIQGLNESPRALEGRKMVDEERKLNTKEKEQIHNTKLIEV